MRMPRNTRNHPGRNAALSDLVTLVGLVLTDSVRSDQLAAIDLGIEIQHLRIDAQSSLGKQQIAKHNPRTLKPIGNIEYLRNQREAVADIERRRNHPRIIAK